MIKHFAIVSRTPFFSLGFGFSLRGGGTLPPPPSKPKFLQALEPQTHLQQADDQTSS